MSENYFNEEAAKAAESETAAQEKKFSPMPYIIAIVAVALLAAIIGTGMVRSYSGRLTKANTDIVELTNELNATTEKLHQTEDELASVQMELTATQDELTATKGQLEEATASLASALETNDLLQGAVNEMGDAAEKIQATINAVNAKIKEEAMASARNGNIANKEFWDLKQSEAMESTQKLTGLLTGFGAFTGEELVLTEEAPAEEAAAEEAPAEEAAVEEAPAEETAVEEAPAEEAPAEEAAAEEAPAEEAAAEEAAAEEAPAEEAAVEEAPAEEAPAEEAPEEEAAEEETAVEEAPAEAAPAEEAAPEEPKNVAKQTMKKVTALRK